MCSNITKDRLVSKKQPNIFFKLQVMIFISTENTRPSAILVSESYTCIARTTLLIYGQLHCEVSTDLNTRWNSDTANKLCMYIGDNLSKKTISL